MIETIAQWYFEHLNYWTITLLMAIESSFIPFPSEVVVPPAAFVAAGSNSSLNIYLVVLFSTIGADIGALINYYLARYLGRPVVYAFARSKFGRMCMINSEKVHRAEVYFDKRGGVSTFVGRLIPAVRQLISIPAGLAKMKISTFLLFTTLGAGVWNGLLAGLGYYFGRVSGMSKEQLIEKVSIYSHEIGYSILALVLVVLTYYFVKSQRKKSKSQEADTDNNAG